MRSTLLLSLLLICTFTAGASAQKVTINVRNGSLDNVLRQITGQTSVQIVYNTETATKIRYENLEIRQADMGEALETVLAGTGLTYELVDGIYIIRERQAQQPQGQSGSVAGRVTDQGGAPLTGAVVMLKGTQRGVATDANGRFRLDNIQERNVVLQVSYLGKVTREVSVAQGSETTVKLDDAEQRIEDVVVTGYQTISKERATGSFSVVGGERLERAHASDLSTALLGTTAGMTGTENADGSVNFTIRGITTLGGQGGDEALKARSPLVVVDGFPIEGGFGDINPRDVESVTVLKDAASASIWGARSANGVIVVTTKKGRAAGPGGKQVHVEADVSFRFGQKTDLGHSLLTASTADQIMFERMAFEKGWIKPVDDDFTKIQSSISLGKQLLYDHASGHITTQEMEAGFAGLGKNDNRRQIEDLLLENPLLQQYNLNVSHASDAARSYASVMYENAVGSLIREKNERWRINFNNQTSIYKWLDFSMGINVHYNTADSGGLDMEAIADLSPYEMILDAEGNYAPQANGINAQQLRKVNADALPYGDWTYNILQETRNTDIRNEQLNTRFQAGFLFRIIDGLTFDTKFQYEINKGETRHHWNEQTFKVRDIANTHIEYDLESGTVKTQYVPKGGIMQRSSTENKNYTWRNQFAFNRHFGSKHDLSAIAGFEITENKLDGAVNPYLFGYDEKTNSSTPLPYGIYSPKTIGGGTKNYIVNEQAATTRLTYRDDRFVSVYGNFSYTYDMRYGISGSIRSDASNLISDDPSYRWAPLWSVGGMWNAHNETFIAELPWVNRLALRVTYGFNGNVNKDTSVKTLISTSQVPSPITGIAFSSIAQLGNPFLRWEKTGTFNAGVDFAFFSNLLTGSVDVYSKQGRDIIGSILIPKALGGGLDNSSQMMNNAKLSNKGIEVAIGVNTRITDRIGFSTNITYSYNRNEITYLKHPQGNADAIIGGTFMEGYPVESVWAYRYLGMKDGLAWVQGPGGNSISMDDFSIQYASAGKEFLRYMGPAVSPHNLGWQGRFNVYGVNFSFLVTGQFGGRFRAPTFNYEIHDGVKDISNKFIRDVIDGSDKIPGWPPEGRPLGFSWNGYVPNLNTLVENSSHIKLKEVTVDYMLPERLTSPLGFDSLKIYGQVRNLGCLWTKNSQGYDPEWLPGTVKPVTTFLVGLNIKFK